MPSETTSSVKQERLRRGMTQQELADKCAEAGAAVDESHISRIERGIYSPRPRLRAVLAKLLGLDVDLKQSTQPEHELSGSRA
ncbi:helix-turn-helix transcriptional regulator [Streptomyces phaeochromogenes]